MPHYQPPFSISPFAQRLLADIAEGLRRCLLQKTLEKNSQQQRINRVRNIQGSLAIEGNTLTQDQITAILDGRRVIAAPREIQEVHNAIAAYDELRNWQPHSEPNLLAAHGLLMKGLLADAGRYRLGGVGVMSGETVIHMAPPADRVPLLMRQLLEWLQGTDQNPLIASCVFHYEFEFIHPFADGNGRMGRLWQSLILSRWNPLLANIPIESLVFEHQAQYYLALRQSTAATDSVFFIEFMLQMILAALNTESTPQVTPQVEALLRVLVGQMTRHQLQQALGLTDRKSFRERYLAPALAEGFIQMTLPDKPNSRLQKYQRTDKAISMHGSLANAP